MCSTRKHGLFIKERETGGVVVDARGRCVRTVNKKREERESVVVSGLYITRKGNQGADAGQQQGQWQPMAPAVLTCQPKQGQPRAPFETLVVLRFH